MIEANIREDWMIKRVVTKFGVLKIDNGRDTVISC